VTPGFAQPRSKLPWLPYESLDRVIINSHNFTPAATFSVNGKAPTAVWCPSRDTAGNGTTTLTDLIGGQNGTLTNMDPGTDWVADTSAGGVRALDFDGTNDYVNASTAGVITGSNLSVSVWVNIARTLSTTQGIVVKNNNGASNNYGLWAFSGGVRFWVHTASGVRSAIASPSLNTWVHLCGTYDGSNLRIYLNGSLIQTVAGTGNIVTAAEPFWIGAIPLGGTPIAPLLGRVDDARIWNVALNAGDVSYLHNSGSGRGRVS
jgi:hypothetical protein